MKPTLVALVMAGGWFTFTVKLCVAAVPTLLLAVMVTMVSPPVAAAGVPEIQGDHGPRGCSDEKSKHETERQHPSRIESGVLMLMQSVAQEIHD